MPYKKTSHKDCSIDQADSLRQTHKARRKRKKRIPVAIGTSDCPTVLVFSAASFQSSLGEVGYVPETSVTILADGNNRAVIQPGQPSDLTLRMGI